MVFVKINETFTTIWL